jgi:hypothetical protein
MHHERQIFKLIFHSPMQLVCFADIQRLDVPPKSAAE